MPTPAGGRLRPDFFFREEGVAVEVEDHACHGAREAHRRDPRRFDALGRCPEVRLIVRVTAEEVLHYPDRFVHRVREALAAARQGGSRECAGGVGR
ncbi:hypothetical protein [Streptomyces sp. NRRL S-1521]|uniref:hypothetical protein n=1 Tax=Streptomyces sp. NRRL S-1521 TaxID=1609100 RepID=UPI000748EF2A|nr:hypothetical protein [Streptomyces sp. NRRL S-1521]KUL47845.1 hypothetical protein ADL30_36060 [Streptomyces sp. NRRL S-1521]